MKARLLILTVLLLVACSPIYTGLPQTAVTEVVSQLYDYAFNTLLLLDSPNFTSTNQDLTHGFDPTAIQTAPLQPPDPVDLTNLEFQRRQRAQQLQIDISSAQRSPVDSSYLSTLGFTGASELWCVETVMWDQGWPLFYHNLFAIKKGASWAVEILFEGQFLLSQDIHLSSQAPDSVQDRYQAVNCQWPRIEPEQITQAWIGLIMAVLGLIGAATQLYPVIRNLDSNQQRPYQILGAAIGFIIAAIGIFLIL